MTAIGREMSVRCEPPGTFMMCEWARRAIASCDSGVIIWSSIPMTYQDGIVFHAAAEDAVSNAAVAAGRCVAHSRRAVRAGRSEAKLRRKMFSERTRLRPLLLR